MAAALVETNSVPATACVTGVLKPTVLELLVDLGAACAAYSDLAVRNLKTLRIQCDEVWSFVAAV